LRCVVRAAAALAAGLTRLDELAERTAEFEVRPDIAGFDDLAHAFDVHGSLLAARATLDCAIERRETRGAHNRAHSPALDPVMRVNLVWALDGSVTREQVPLPSGAVAAVSGQSRRRQGGDSSSRYLTSRPVDARPGVG